MQKTNQTTGTATLIQPPQILVLVGKHSGHFNILLMLIAAFAYATLLATMSLQFVGSHPDEIGKARQIISDFRNWNHPQLLLFNLEFGKNVLGLTSIGEVVRLGRHISNLYAAATVFILALIGSRLFGVVGAWIFFGVFAGNSAMLIAGRYLKEDIFLLFGLAILALALTFTTEDRKLWFSGIIGGIGCAVVLSAKYIGIVFIVLFLLIYFYQARSEWRRHLLPLVLTFLAAALAINYRLVISLQDFFDGIGKEFSHATTSHLGIISGPWSELYPDMMREVFPLIALVAIPVFLMFLGITGCRRPVAALLAFAIGSILTYGFFIQFAPTKIPRYCFPILLLLPLVFLVAAGELWRNAKHSLLKLTVLVPGLLLLAQTVLTSVTLIGAIRNDTRDQLFRYVTSSPTLANTLILTDAHTRLWRRLRWEEHPRANYMLPRKLTYSLMQERLEETEGEIQNPNGLRIRWSPFATDPCFFGECDDVDYIIITCTAFTRFFRDNINLDTANARRKAMYDDWRRNAKVVKQFGSSNNDFESRFGLYESPCITVLRNNNSSGSSRYYDLGRN